VDAEAAFEAICHSKDYFDANVTSLDSWHTYNPTSKQVDFTTIQKPHAIVDSIEAFKERSEKKFK